MIRLTLAILLISLSATYAVDNHKIIGHSSTFFSEASLFLNPHGHGRAEGTQWAVLVAGSNTWENYRHQADVCHAYQILKKGGLKDENIIVMMYDDIADNPENPRPGVIINSPNGSDVYKGVPKDYTGEDVTGENFFNVLLGNKTAIKGGNGKVVNSGPNDHIFVYYADHGSPLILGMPNDEYITAQELNKVLKEKHAMKTYKSMVFYLEACEAGSMFNGLLPKNIKIYATTASTPHEQSFAYYCPGMENPPPKEFNICLGDLYSISWMEDWDRNSTAAETLKQQFEKVKKRTANFSQVLEYGDLSLSEKNASVYLGKNPAKDAYVNELLPSQFSSVHQRDAKLLHLREKFRRAPKGSQSKLEAKKQIIKALKDRVYVDNSIEMITKLLFGSEKGLEVMKSVRPVGQAPVDDWDCFKTLLHTYEAKCGTLSPYGRKHTRIFANFCNAGIRQEQMEKATTQVCA